MAKQVRDDLTWQDVDVGSLKGALAKAYNQYKVASAAARDAREAFEEAFKKQAASKLGEGNSCLFSHKFGKLSIAVVAASDTKKSKTDKAAKFSF